MNFGAPPSKGKFVPTPPERGSFPLDHEGDCRDAMMRYMSCLKDNRSRSGACRLLSKEYLECRMENNLMAKDDFKNLGLGDVALDSASTTTVASPAESITKPSIDQKT
ncbi:hypothetical protein GQ42DRAFT_156097 [Ramicandelaber brevisporus]|nr:hypothetical protein GQ42DRAFT_156097 [Ramicandelaber brevisporus]